MNSFKNLHDGLAYEICRQAEVLESGGTVRQETRHWEPATKRTTSMRVKETADDYRYFPEPDLAPFDLSDEFIESVRARLPELPDAKRARFVETYGLSSADGGNLAADAALSAFFDEAASANTSLAKPIANLLLNDVSAYLNANNVALADARFRPEHIAELVKLVADDTISSKQAKEVFALMVESGDFPQKIVDEKGMKQVSDAGALEAEIKVVLEANPDKVAEYRGGKVGLIGFFVGQVMKATGGQGNPKLINELLQKHLSD